MVPRQLASRAGPDEASALTVNAQKAGDTSTMGWSGARGSDITNASPLFRKWSAPIDSNSQSTNSQSFLILGCKVVFAQLYARVSQQAVFDELLKLISMQAFEQVLGGHLETVRGVDD